MPLLSLSLSGFTLSPTLRLRIAHEPPHGLAALPRPLEARRPLGSGSAASSFARRGDSQRARWCARPRAEARWQGAPT
eukprot:14358-Rhodomonas_salina.2